MRGFDGPAKRRLKVQFICGGSELHSIRGALTSDARGSMSYLDEFKDDVFISYAHRDNKPLTEGQKGWVTRFHETLETVLGQRLGADPAVFRDGKLAGNDYFDDKLMQEIAVTAIFVS